MMAKLMRRAEELCRPMQRRQVIQLANELGDLLGTDAVEAEDTRIMIERRGLRQRWLIDPRLRFLRGRTK